jgi:formylglycine-generating enzyme required for sulfatase activity
MKLWSKHLRTLIFVGCAVGWAAVLGGQPVDTLIEIAGGTFMMGSPSNEPNRKPASTILDKPIDYEVQHPVSVSGFRIRAYDVSVGEFRAFVKATGYKTTAETSEGAWYLSHDDFLKGDPDADKAVFGEHWITTFGFPKGDTTSWSNPGFDQSDLDPVVCVSWYDAVAYANWASLRDGLKPVYSFRGVSDPKVWASLGWNHPIEDKRLYNHSLLDQFGLEPGAWDVDDGLAIDWHAGGYRLPTEAEWELAARGGIGAPYQMYPGSNNPHELAWDESDSDGHTHPVGLKKPNRLGLYDMSGNVYQWCADLYEADVSMLRATNPKGEEYINDRERSIRGSSWSNNWSFVRVAFRHSFDPAERISILGFRLVAASANPNPANTAKPAGGFVSVPGGSFVFGEKTENERKVSVSAFQIKKTDVTVAEFATFVKATGYRTSAEIDGNAATWKNPGFQQTDASPVVYVSWYDAIAYCNWTSVRDGLKPVYSQGGSTDFKMWAAGWNKKALPEFPPSFGDTATDWGANGYRLPTETEWELAARGGPQTPLQRFAGSDTAGDVAWYGDNSKGQPHAVGQKKPNSLGLYDMNGNVSQWCTNWPGGNIDADPKGDRWGDGDTGKELRGGSWKDDASDVGITNRSTDSPEQYRDDVGFRPIYSLDP